MNPASTPLRVALCGRSGAGKTTVAEHLRDRYDFHLMQSGKLCREIARELFDQDAKSVMNQLTDAVRQIDPDAWIKAALRSLPARQPAVFDSARFPGDEKILAVLDFHLVRIDCPLDTAHTRLSARGQRLSAETDFAHETETNFINMTPHATLRNDGDVDDLRAQLDDMIARLRSDSG